MIPELTHNWSECFMRNTGILVLLSSAILHLVLLMDNAPHDWTPTTHTNLLRPTFKWLIRLNCHTTPYITQLMQHSHHDACCTSLVITHAYFWQPYSYRFHALTATTPQFDALIIPLHMHVLTLC